MMSKWESLLSNALGALWLSHAPCLFVNTSKHRWFLDLGVPQKLNGADLVEFHEISSDAVLHLMSVAESPELYPMLRHCKNKHPMCTQWAMAGNCKDNGVHNEYMMDTDCCPVCGSAAQLAFLMQCPIDPDDYTAFKGPGSVTKHFERTIKEFPQYNPQVLARPTYLPGDTEETADYKIGPWIITLDGVATDEEMERLISWGKNLGYERSTDGGDESVRCILMLCCLEFNNVLSDNCVLQ